MLRSGAAWFGPPDKVVRVSPALLGRLWLPYKRSHISAQEKIDELQTG